MKPDPKKLFAEALGALGAGKIEPARKALETLNALAPGNPDVLSYLGFAEASLNRSEGLAKTSKAAELSPQNPQILMNHAFALEKAGQTDKAIEVLEAANTAVPEQVPILNHLTRLLVEQGNFQKARPLTGKLVKLAPRDPVFAQRHLRVLTTLGDCEAGKKFLTSIESHFSGTPFLDEMKGRAARVAQDWPEAYKYYKALSEKDPENLVYKRGLAHSLLGLEDFSRVVPILKEIRLKEPENDQVIYSMAYALFNDNRHEECLPFVEKVLEKEPDHVEALIIKGRSLVYFGELEEAEKIFRRVLELSPDHPMAVLQMAKVDPPKKGSKTFAKIEAMEKAAAEKNEFKPLMNFTLGEMYEGIGDYDRAFEFFKRGNQAAGKTFRARGFYFDAEKTRSEFERIKTFFSKENLGALKGKGVETDLPIFIVGMPRSGTTLLEQIISSHPRVFGAGELPLGNWMMEKFFSELKNPSGFKEKLAAEAKTHARFYLDFLAELEPGQIRATDKMPNNFRNLGFLQVIFPKASYIAIRRNPLDICLSIYKGFFSKGFTYALDLRDLGTYYREFHNLMEFWKTALPYPVLEVQYEKFVANPEEEGEGIFAALGLDWDPAFLEFYKRKNKVFTQSTLQVREPVHKKAIDKWRRYEKHLGPLLEGLGEDIIKTLDV